MASEHHNPARDRKFNLEQGEMKLRTHVGKHAPLRLALVFQHERKRWEVQTQYHREGEAPVLLGIEDLEIFPSDTLIAQAVLVA
jgi:hypothetical protein